ncbi:hypothetical protein [Virgisporangium aurantiacum]|uniref:Uncharacterized protein n=1 Tax=Virgisporangium aurantiacum TaxID=175570 RepID=A0A8J4E4U0_9ACTN|nr:hypothetical protein [Virgisporangium aurantiacum]GIJ61449.1 hypothetical protein Vau01_089650 [Virgisporangium aurantiacum]
MAVLLVGSNPGLALHDGDGPPVAFVSVWRVDWSVRGAGTALVLSHSGRVRVVTPVPELGRWLADAFNRHFPEVAGLPWSEPAVTAAPVRLDLDPATGLTATAADVTVEISGPMDRRRVDVAAFPGNGLRLSTVYTPCAEGRLTIAGRRVDGAPRVTGASSTAFLADAEVWSD